MKRSYRNLNHQKTRPDAIDRLSAILFPDKVGFFRRQEHPKIKYSHKDYTSAEYKEKSLGLSDK
jgi:hypothetical protein